MLGWRRARARRVPWIARPVASAAWAIRRTAWPPSRVRCRPSGPAGSVVNGTPCSTSHSIAARLCSAMNCATCSSTRPAPASWVSRTCELDAVVAAEDADDAALGAGRGRLPEVALGEHDDGVPVGEVEGHGEAGQAGPDDDDGRGGGIRRGGTRRGGLGGGGGRAHRVNSMRPRWVVSVPGRESPRVGRPPTRQGARRRMPQDWHRAER